MFECCARRQANLLRPSRLAILWFVLLLLVQLSGGRLAQSADGNSKAAPSIEQEAAKMQRVPTRTPQESLNEIVMRDGFHAELVAAEPLVHDPVAIDFDEDGRAFVVELPPYNAYALDHFDGHGSISVLEDSDDDGVYDKSTIFADDLKYPTAVACWDGGLFVGDAPELLYLKDTDGDGRADLRHVLFSGFGSDHAGEAHLNSFRWGFDNRIHFSTSLSGGEVRVISDDASSTTAEKTVSVRNRGVIFDPRNPTSFELTTGGGQHGMSLDNQGRRFVCSNSVPAQLLMYDDRYVARNPFVQAPQAAVDIAPEGKFTTLFRISPVEPWRELRTRLRREGRFRGSDEGGRPFGFFTGATGITIYRGDAWPTDYRGNLIVGDVANNLVYRAKLSENGVGLTATRADMDAEFLASRDIWFRPVQFANAPDGSLYVLDMCRELIEGAAFLPPEFLKVIDAASGSDRGRIYRMVPDGFARRATPKLSKASTSELVELLDHPNGWHRDTASRLLYQRQDRSAGAALRRLARDGKTPEGRLTALHSLNGLQSLDEGTLLRGLNDSAPLVRIQALQIAEDWAAKSAAVRSAVHILAGDADLNVRYQAAFSLGSFDGPERDASLVRLAQRDGSDVWMRLAIQSSLEVGAANVFQALSGDEQFRQAVTGRDLLASLATQIGSANRAFETSAVLRVVNALPESEKSLGESLMQALVKNLKGADRDRLLAAAGGRAASFFAELLTDSRRIAADDSAAERERVAAVRALQYGSFSIDRDLLSDLLQARQPQSVQLAAIDALSVFPDAAVSELLLTRWSSMSPAVRARTTETLLSRATWTQSLLQAVSNNKVSKADISTSHVGLLSAHPDPAIRETVKNVFGSTASSSTEQRAEVVKAYQSALALAGDLDRGRALFRRNCSACHRLEDFGTQIGAELKAISDRGDASVLLNILDPNREVKPKFVSYVVERADGRIVSGMIVSENANSVTIRKLDGTESSIQRTEIDELRSTGQSFMPEGLEKLFDAQGAADLLEYLRVAGG